MAVAILAHERFPDHAKTAVGILRYSDRDVVAVIDRAHAGERVAEHLPDVQDAPIVEGVDDITADIEELLIGIAPIGGGFEESWRPDVRAALKRGADVTAGLHYLLNDDEEFAALAEANDCTLRDVRDPPTDLSVANGTAGDVDATVIATVGTDCSVGKMTTTMELVDALRAKGYDAAAVPTGQTGVMIEGWGIVVDRVIGDFLNGAVEQMVTKAAADHDVLVVEGQGTIVHPAYSAVTCGILHGAMPDALVLCHEAGRETIHGYSAFDLPPVETYVDLYESLAALVAEAEVAAGMLNTRTIESDAAAQEAVDAYAEAIDAPASDPLRFDLTESIEALL